MSPTPDLSGCAAKMRRALHHMQDFDTRAVQFIYKVSPYRSVVDIDTKTGETVLRLTQDVVQPPVNDWSVIVGDAAHNIISALDHLVCQLSILNGGDAECDRTAFPIFDRDSPQIQEMIRRRIGTLSESDQQIVRELQPYSRGDLDLARADPLWLLYRMDVIDKHRRMHLVNSALFDEAPILARGYKISDLVVSQGTKAGDEILRFRAVREASTGEDDVDAKVIVVITFGPGSGPLTGQSVRTELPSIFSYVRDNVFPKFEHRVGTLPPVGDVQVSDIS